MEVISLDTHMGQGSKMQRYKFEGEEFLLTSGIYFDRVPNPLLNTYHSVYTLRNQIINYLPKVSNGRNFHPLFSKLYVPTSMDFEPIWAFKGPTETFVNSGFQPLGILHLTLRDHPQELADMVNGIYVSTKEEYHRYRNALNKLYERLLSGKGNGRYGLASEEEQIKLAGLTYIVLSTCESIDGLFVEHEQIKNEWSREPRNIKFSQKQAELYSAKLRNVWFSGLTPSQFFYRHQEKSDENCFWLITPPPFDAQRIDSYSHSEFKIDDMYKWVDYFMPVLSARGSRAMMVFPTQSSTRKELVQYMGFKNIGNRLVNSNGLLMIDDVAEYPGMRTSHIILNYDPRNTTYKIGV